MKICIFPNDPIIEYYKKGEIKDRYFNPNDFFDEVHIISFIEKDIEEERVKNLVGNAKLKIHSVGKINLKNYLPLFNIIFLPSLLAFWYCSTW